VTLFEPIIEGLNRHDVRYVIVGGVAVVLHGHVRLTADLDLAIDLSSREAAKAIEALVEMRFRPRAPVDPKDFANPAIRNRWVAEKGMTVFSMYDPTDPVRQVDVFAENPVDFEELWERSLVMDLAGISARVASISDLIRMKRIAGRLQDLADVEALERISSEAEG
jgi:hypothetical protein